MMLNFSAPADPPGRKVCETAMETGGEMKLAIRAISVIRGKNLLGK